MCDLVALYDNTEEIAFRRIAIYKNGESIRVSGRVPEWYKKNFERIRIEFKSWYRKGIRLLAMRKSVAGSFLMLVIRIVKHKNIYGLPGKKLAWDR